MEKYYELQDDTINRFNDIMSTLAFPTRINFKAIGDSKLKKLIKVQKVSDVYEYLTKHQLLVFINEDLYDKMYDDPKSIEVLFMEELNNIEVNLKTGKLKISKPNISTSSSILEKYGLDEVKRIKELETLSIQQADEMAKENGQNKEKEDSFAF